MANRKKAIFLSIIMLAAAIVFMVNGCSEKANHEGKIIFTKAPTAINMEEILDGSYRYSEGLGIFIGEQNLSSESAKPLTADFLSARAAEISYDGKTMVFSGKKTAEDSWQIWTLDLNTKKISQVTGSTGNCTDPTWLPDGRIAFSRKVTDDSHSQYHALFTIDPSGCCEQRITFQPHDDLNAIVMNDGRLLFTSRQIYPENGVLKYLAMRPDGTKAELFYQPDPSVRSASKPSEKKDGTIAFVERGLFRTVKFSRPLHSMAQPSLHGVDLLQSARSMENEAFLCSVAKPGSAVFSVSAISLKNETNTSMEIADPGFHLIEPVMVEARVVPKKLPSLMNMEDPSGYIVCLNADASTIQVDQMLGNASKIQVLDYSGIVGETDIAQDGSFYVALPADQPLRFQTVNSDGNIVRGPSSWIWLRPSERRGCTGCHEDKEIVPENVVPLAVEKAPVAMVK